MKMPRLSDLPVYFKLFVTMMLCMCGLTYITLLVHIWIDTQMKASMIIEAYGYMEYIELSNLAHDYFPYYTFFLFAVPALVFMFTSFPGGLKGFFGILPFLVIITDIASMYLIPYVWEGFG